MLQSPGHVALDGTEIEKNGLALSLMLLWCHLTGTWCSHLAALLGQNPGSSLSFASAHLTWLGSGSKPSSTPSIPACRPDSQGCQNQAIRNLTEHIRPHDGLPFRQLDLCRGAEEPGLGFGVARDK